MNRLVASAVLIVLAASAPLCAQAADPPAKSVTFATGHTTAHLRGQVAGDAGATYAIDGRAGQTLSVVLESRNTSLNLNLIAPDASEAMFIGSTQGRQARVMLPADGRYRVQVYLMRSAARRQERAAFSLQVAVSGQALPPLPAAQDARVAGTPFHAVSEVPCRMPGTAPGALCRAGVVRRGHDGTATVMLRHPAGEPRRSVLFVQGRPVASDSAQALHASRQGDLHLLDLGSDEHYELPDALLTGG